MEQDRIEKMNALLTKVEVDSTEDKPINLTPPKGGRWLLALLLFFTYLPLQLILSLPIALVMIAAQGLETQAEIIAFSTSPPMLWLAIVAAGLAAVVTIIAALVWPPLWRRFSKHDRYSFAEWLDWRKMGLKETILLPLMTIGFLVGIGGLFSFFAEDVSVEAQLMLFSTTGLQIISAITVTTVVPFAEEFIFRGALYSALLPRKNPDSLTLIDHLVPYFVTSIGFAAVHLLAGFETPSAILMITMFSFYLGALRVFTGSVKASIIGHVVWNSFGALSLILANIIT